MSSSRINVSSSLSPEPQTVGTKTNKQDHGIQKSVKPMQVPELIGLLSKSL